MQTTLFFILLIASFLHLQSLAFSLKRYPSNFGRSPSLLGNTLGSVANVANDVVGGVTEDLGPQPAPATPKPTAQSHLPPVKPAEPGLDLGIVSVGSDPQGGLDLGVNLPGNTDKVSLSPSGLNANVDTPLGEIDTGISSSGVKAKVDTPLVSAEVGLGPSGAKFALPIATIAAGPSGIGVDSPVGGLDIGPSGIAVHGTGGPTVTIPLPGFPTILHNSKPGATTTDRPTAVPTEGDGNSEAESTSDADDTPPFSPSQTIPSSLDLGTQTNLDPGLPTNINRNPEGHSLLPLPPPGYDPSNPGKAFFTSGSSPSGPPFPPMDQRPTQDRPPTFRAAIIAVLVLAILLMLALCLTCCMRRYRKKLRTKNSEFWCRWFNDETEKGFGSDEKAANWKSPSQVRATSYGAVVTGKGDRSLVPASNTRRCSNLSSTSNTTGSFLSTAPDLDSPCTSNNEDDDLFFGGAPRKVSRMSAYSTNSPLSSESSHTMIHPPSHPADPFADSASWEEEEPRILIPPKIITTSSADSFRDVNGGDTQILFIPGDADSLATRDSASLHGHYRDSNSSCDESTVVAVQSSKEAYGYGYGYGLTSPKGDWRQSGSSASTVTRSRPRPDSGRTFGSLSSDDSEGCSTDESTNESLSRVVWKFQ